jgi:DNA polymerase III epsilon subunit-like protein
MSSSVGSPLTDEAPYLASIYGFLGAHYDSCCEFGVPRSYVAFDLETTGYSRQEDLVLMVGHCVVEDSEPQFYEGVLLNWYAYDVCGENGQRLLPHHWLDRKLDAIRQQMGAGWHGITRDELESHGKHPCEALEYVLRLYERQRECGAVFAAHNMLRFDAPLLEGAMREFIGAEWVFYDSEVLDTAAVEKAAAGGFVPRNSESVIGYFRRVLRLRSRIKYNLDLCAAKYGLADSYELDWEARHRADFDALLVHYMIEAQRELLAG